MTRRILVLDARELYDLHAALSRWITERETFGRDSTGLRQLVARLEDVRSTDICSPADPETPDAAWVTTEQAAAILHRHPRTIRRMIAAGQLEHRHVGRTPLVRIQE